METSDIRIEGMSCEACVASARQALQGVGGVRSVQVDLTHGRATVEHAGEVQASDLLSAITEAGYDARIEEAAVAS